MNRDRNEQKLLWMKMGIAAALIALAAALRLVAHPWNFTPIGAMALFAGATFQQRWMKFVFPLAALFAGDIFVGFHKLMLIMYLSILISVAIGMWIGERRKATRLVGGTFLGALQFFIITNFAVWLVFTTYPRSGTGLLACYGAGLPLFWNTLAGDMVYVCLLFGGYTLAERFFLSQRPAVELVR